VNICGLCGWQRYVCGMSGVCMIQERAQMGERGVWAGGEVKGYLGKLLNLTYKLYLKT